MPSSRETILAALHTLLQSLPATALRDEVLPERIPPSGLIILRAGRAGGHALAFALPLPAPRRDRSGRPRGSA